MNPKLSVIPLLLKTRDQFINLISVETPSLENLFTVVESASMPSNLFLKHLVVLADFGGEMLQRVSAEFESLFPNGELNYYWRGEPRTYKFRALPQRKLSNKTLKIDGNQLLKPYQLNDLRKDAIVLLLFGSTYSDKDQKVTATLAKCEIGEYLGNVEELTTYIRQRYIWVSRITMGAKSNNLGQIAQRFVIEYISQHLDLKKVKIQQGGRLPNVTHTDPATGKTTSFDIIVTDSKKYVAIEVGFQVTTNSVIERKAGQAQARFIQAENANHKIAYVLDGAGNFQREPALRTICSYSHCTVAFSRSELDLLCQFLREQF